MTKNIRYSFGEQSIMKRIPLAYTFGTHEHKYLDKLLELLKEFPIGTVYADNNFTYESKIKNSILISGKKDTQKIERDHLTLRTRIKRLSRKTIFFQKTKISTKRW